MLLPHLRNKYAITIIMFVVWVAFFDRNDLIAQYTYSKKLDKLRQDREYYLAEIDVNKKSMDELMSNTRNLEKFAREKYLMKRENEEIFLLIK
jgi:cell division protein FtsB